MSDDDEPIPSPSEKFKRTYSRTKRHRDDNTTDDSVDEICQIPIPPKRPSSSASRGFSTLSQIPHPKLNLTSTWTPPSVKVKNFYSVSTPFLSPIRPIASTSVSPKTAKPKSTQSKLINIDSESSALLQGEQMLNDTVIDIYLSHLIDQLDESLANSIHLFSTFFYYKFDSNNPNFSLDIGHEAKKWEKDVKLFDKTFLVTPICLHQHWLLVIVCLRTSGVHFKHNLDWQSHHQIGSMLMFNSLGFSNMRLLTRPIRNFLSARWKIERPGKPVPNFSDSTILPDKAAIVPKQRNTSDCGIYLLHSVERFFSNHAKYYSKIFRGENLQFEWYFEAKRLRAQIFRQIDEAKRGL